MWYILLSSELRKCSEEGSAWLQVHFSLLLLGLRIMKAASVLRKCPSHVILSERWSSARTQRHVTECLYPILSGILFCNEWRRPLAKPRQWPYLCAKHTHGVKENAHPSNVRKQGEGNGSRGGIFVPSTSSSAPRVKCRSICSAPRW